MRFAVAVFSFAVVAAVAAQADIRFEVKSSSTTEPTKVETQEVRITGDKLALDSKSEAGSVSMIFKSKDKVLYVVQHDEKRYMQMDEAFAEQLGGQMTSALKQMEGELAKLPPEQRAQVEAMMNQAIQKPAAPPPLEFKATGATRDVDGIACKHWEVWSGKKKEREMWVASFGDLDLDRADFASLEALGDFFTEMWRSAPMLQRMNRNELLTGDLERIQGFPLLAHKLEDGKVTQETRIGGFQRDKIPAAAFEVPAGYARREIGSME